MKLPSLLPDELSYTGAAKNGRDLYELLQKNSRHFSRFVAAAIYDETWCIKNSAFIRLSLQWLTSQFFRDRLQIDLAKHVAAAMRRHHRFAERWLPHDLSAHVDGQEFPINSLLWGTSCEWMRQKIRSECRDQGSTALEFEELTPHLFIQMDSYMREGEIRNLWSRTEEELKDLLELVTSWRMADLALRIQQEFVKYLDESNAIDWLIKAHGSRWQALRASAIAFVNGMDQGVVIGGRSADELSFEFLDFRSRTIRVFERLRHVITKLVFRHRLNQEADFDQVIHKTPSLQVVSVSESADFSDKLLELPTKVIGLDLSKCAWITQKNLRRILENHPSLRSLNLGSNVQLNYACWGLLKLLKALEKLDVSRCHQIHDQDLNVILQAARGVSHLNLERCTHLSDLSFFEIPKFLDQLVELNLSECRIYDAGLIDILSKCRRLTYLALRKCTTLSDRGILEAVRNAPQLQTIDLTGCAVTQASLQAIQAARPGLVLEKARSAQ